MAAISLLPRIEYSPVIGFDVHSQSGLAARLGDRRVAHRWNKGPTFVTDRDVELAKAKLAKQLLQWCMGDGQA